MLTTFVIIICVVRLYVWRWVRVFFSRSLCGPPGVWNVGKGWLPPPPCLLAGTGLDSGWKNQTANPKSVLFFGPQFFCHLSFCSTKMRNRNDNFRAENNLPHEVYLCASSKSSIWQGIASNPRSPQRWKFMCWSAVQQQNLHSDAHRAAPSMHHQAFSCVWLRSGKSKSSNSSAAHELR